VHVQWPTPFGGHTRPANERSGYWLHGNQAVKGESSASPMRTITSATLSVTVAAPTNVNSAFWNTAVDGLGAMFS
jgi:hypothetical protein